MRKYFILLCSCLLLGQIESKSVDQDFTFPKMKWDVDPSRYYWKYDSNSNKSIYQSIYSRTLKSLKKEARIVADKSYFSFWTFSLNTGNHSFQTDSSFIFMGLKENAFNYAKRKANARYPDEISRLMEMSSQIPRGPLKGLYFVPGFDKPLPHGFWNDDIFKGIVKQYIQDDIIDDITKGFPLGGRWEYPRHFYKYKSK